MPKKKERKAAINLMTEIKWKSCTLKMKIWECKIIKQLCLEEYGTHCQQINGNEGARGGIHSGSLQQEQQKREQQQQLQQQRIRPRPLHEPYELHFR